MTPAQTRHVVEGVRRERRQWSLHGAWHSVAYDRAKKLPQLDEVIDADRFKPTAAKPARESFGSLKDMARAQKKRHERRQPTKEEEPA